MMLSYAAPACNRKNNEQRIEIGITRIWRMLSGAHCAHMSFRSMRAKLCFIRVFRVRGYDCTSRLTMKYHTILRYATLS